MSNSVLKLGRFLGRREAFAAVAGRCSAEEAEHLRVIREEQLYRSLGYNWDDFCSKHLGSSRRQIDRTLRLLEEFGPAYFHVAQMAHVTADEYRAIAAHIDGNGVRVDGNVVALLPENSEQVSAAVAELLRRERPEGPRAKTAALRVSDIAKRCAAAVEALEYVECPPNDQERMQIMTTICRLFTAAKRRGFWVAT